MVFWKNILRLVWKKSVGPPLIALSCLIAALVYFLIPTIYVSSASMVLTAPAAGGTLPTDPTKRAGLTNPLLQFNDGLRTTAGILILAMNSPDVMADLGIVEDGPTQLIVNDGRTNPDLLGISTNGPFIYIETDSRSEAAAKEVTLRAQQRIRQELTKRQMALKAPKSTFIWIADVVPPSTPEAKLTGKLTAAAAALILTLLAGFGTAYLVTELRASRRSARAAAGAEPGEPSEDEAEPEHSAAVPAPAAVPGSRSAGEAVPVHPSAATRDETGAPAGEDDDDEDSETTAVMDATELRMRLAGRNGEATGRDAGARDAKGRDGARRSGHAESESADEPVVVVVPGRGDTKGAERPRRLA
jgi:hypothetical protein